MIHLRTTSKYKHTQRILTTKVSNMDQSLISCYCEGNKMVAGFNPPAATARIPPLAFRQDRTSAAAVSTAPVGWCGCTALSCWASASAWGNICCTSCRRRPPGFLLEQKAALHCLQKHFCLFVCATWHTDVHRLFTFGMISCLLCATPGRKLGYT